ncbi:MAG TPA: hypothetical protein VM659_07490 [Dongiaceae bacterium]|nr:hypothetical protein [Dongiaceae bacterium]
MQSGIPGIAVVTYRTTPSSWFFAEVDRAWIYRFGPFASAQALDDVLAVIYATLPQRAALALVGECDDAGGLLAAATLAAPAPPGRVALVPRAAASWWHALLYRLRSHGARRIVIH